MYQSIHISKHSDLAYVSKHTYFLSLSCFHFFAHTPPDTTEKIFIFLKNIYTSMHIYTICMQLKLTVSSICNMFTISISLFALFALYYLHYISFSSWFGGEKYVFNAEPSRFRPQSIYVRDRQRWEVNFDALELVWASSLFVRASNKMPLKRRIDISTT